MAGMNTKKKTYHEWFAEAVWRRVNKKNETVFDIKESNVFPLGKTNSLRDDAESHVFEVITISRSIFHNRTENSNYGYGAKTTYHMDIRVLKDFLNADHDEVVVSIRSIADENNDKPKQN